MLTPLESQLTAALRQLVTSGEKYRVPNPVHVDAARAALAAADAQDGCGKPIRVAGTNGGHMACGGVLTWIDGTKTRQYCDTCRAGADAVVAA